MELGNDWETEFEGAEAMNTLYKTLQKNDAYERMALDIIFDKLRERNRKTR